MNKLLILFLFSFTSLFAQDYARADQLALSYPKRFKNPEQLAKRINQDFTNDFEKVRAVYTWLAANVGYDMKEFGRFNFSYSSEEDKRTKELVYNERISSHVTSKGKAVCQGYAVTFNEVCRFMGLKAKMISGDGKGYIVRIGGKYTPDHAWNSVEIEGQKYLLDITWATRNERSKGKNLVSYTYFLLPPKDFIKTHYPDNYEDSLLSESISKEEYLKYPIYYSYEYIMKNKLEGVISKKGLNDITFIFEGLAGAKEVFYTVGAKTEKVNKVNFNNGILEFIIPAKQIKRTKELVIFFEEETIVGFKVK